MEIIYLLIPIALLFVVTGVGVFFWAVKNNQYDDLEGPAHQILFDDEPSGRSVHEDQLPDKTPQESSRK